MAWLTDLQNGVFRTMLLDDSLTRLEQSGISVRGPSSGQALAEVKVADFSPPIRHKALQMQHVYVSFFCLENAVRELIIQRLAEHHGRIGGILRSRQKLVKLWQSCGRKRRRRITTPSVRKRISAIPRSGTCHR